MAETSFKISIPAGDELELRLETAQNGTVTAHLRGIGGPALLKLLGEWRGRLRGDPKAWPQPEGVSGPELMLKELVLKARGEWAYPYQEAELCHCRAVPTAVVDRAILAGAHQPEIVSRWTSASTACGTCRKDVTAILNYRLGKKSA